MIRVAFFVYPSAFQNKGGGEILLERLEEYLKKRSDVTVKRFDIWNDRLEDFDILHVFGSVKDCLALMEVARSRRVKVVLESIFWSDFRRAFFEKASFIKKAEMILRHALKLACPFFPSARKKMFETADIIFPNSVNEARQISRLFNVPKEKMFVVPNGVDMRYAGASPELFLDKFGIKDFVLSVGRIEPRKNQLNLIRAMKTVDRDLVIIGDTVSGYGWYYKRCVDAAKKRVHFLGAIPHGSPLLMSAYAACDVFVLPGWFETPGLAAMEAALAGAKVVATDGGSTKEYFQDKVIYLKPNSVDSISSGIKEALLQKKDGTVKQFISGLFTWEKITDKMMEGYRRVLKK